MKTRIAIVVALPLILLASLAGAVAAQDGLTLETLAEALVALTARIDKHGARLQTNEQRLTALETLAAPTQTPTATATPASKAALEIGRRMNVRRGPGTQQKSIGTAEAGARYDITGRNVNADWWQIDYEGEPGWVYAPYVTAEQTDEVKVVATSTPAPTATPRPTTSAPPPTSVPEPTVAAVDLGTAAVALMGLDFLGDGEGWQAFSDSTRAELQLAYQILLTFAADQCDLSYGQAAFLIDSHASLLEEDGVILKDSAKPRAWLMAYLWGFFKDDPDFPLSCADALFSGVIAAIGESSE